MRLLPSTLQVVIEEREPFAIWQSQQKTYVVDAEGAVLAPALREAVLSWMDEMTALVRQTLRARIFFRI
jgi:cell division septal protein FtsQ